jgi:hypothetical protein
VANCGATASAKTQSQEIELTETLTSPIVLGSRDPQNLAILQEYADFWKVPYTLEQVQDRGQLFLTAGLADSAVSPEGPPVIISPVGTEEAKSVARRFGLEIFKEEALLRLPVSSGTFVSLKTALNQFSGSRLKPVLRDGSTTILHQILGTNVHLLSTDLVSEYYRLIYGRLDENPSWKFRLLAMMPFSYDKIPSFIRNRVFKARKNIAQFREEMLGPVECLRTIFLASLVIASGKTIPRIGFWRKGRTHVLAVSHDVETQVGLEDGASRLVEVEKELDIRSTWNIPSERYPLSSQLLTYLAKTGEVGAHDTKHDGRLLFARYKDKVERLIQCRERLELLARGRIRGFRAPLLQHSREILDAVGKAGYRFDSSVPSWEALSPTSLKPHGVGTIFPFRISGIVEVPVSLPQDHQLIRIGELGIAQAVDRLIDVSKWVKGVGGVCVLLTHPDYEFGLEGGQAEYHRLLKSFRSDSSCDILSLGELADWWTNREQSQIRMTEGKASLQQANGQEGADMLELEFVTGYGIEGFKVEKLAGPSVIELSKGSEK